LITEDDLRAAADTIDEASDAELRHKLGKLKETRNARTRREVLRQQAELDSLEFDEAAYQLASQSAEDNDLRNAAHWYRVAAMNDFADSPLKLARVLDALADKYLARPENRVTNREELDLVSEAARWYAAAYAAGDIEAENYLDLLIARHDPTRPRPRATLSAPPDDTDPATDTDLDPSADPGIGSGTDTDPDACALGGLQNVLNLQLTETIAHCASCHPCQNELIKPSSHLPVAPQRTLSNDGRRPGPTPAAGNSRQRAECGSVLNSQPPAPR
jgi:hypothetical protein